MQIAGSKCRICNDPVVLAFEGKFCRGCGTVTHLQCEPAPNCSSCGRQFEYYRPQRPDVSSMAYDPRERRSSNSVGPLLAALLSFLAIILVYYLLTLT